MRLAALWFAPMILLPGVALAQTAPNGGCGDRTMVQANDTLSAIAERCDVSESQILAANPQLDGSADLRVGGAIAIDANATDTANRLKSLAKEAGSELSDAAKSVGSSIAASVEGVLENHPQLNEHIREIGKQIGLGGASENSADVSIEPSSGAPGSSVTVSAEGLPENTPVVIAGGPAHRAYSVLSEGRTTADGKLQGTVKIPSDFGNGAGRYRISIRAMDNSWKASAPVFEIKS